MRIKIEIDIDVKSDKEAEFICTEIDKCLDRVVEHDYDLNYYKAANQ